jgi:hypothetical protein
MIVRKQKTNLTSPGSDNPRVQGSAGFRGEALRYFSEDIVYEDMNFPQPFVGKPAVAAFLEEFDIPGLTFVPDRISDGDGGAAGGGGGGVEACCFTWWGCTR